MLLHNGNKFPSVPLVGAVHMKVMCESLQVLLQKKYISHEKLTYYRKQSSSWEVDRFWASQNSPHVMEPEGSLQHSKVPSTFLYLERYEEHRWKTRADLTLQQCWVGCKVDTLNSAAFSVNGTAERGTASTELKNYHSVQKQHQVRWMF